MGVRRLGWRRPRATCRLDEASERALATVVFTDIVDSTTTLERLGNKAWHALLAPTTPASGKIERVPRPRGQDDGRWVPRDLRQRHPGRSLRHGDDPVGRAMELQIRVGVQRVRSTLGGDARGLAVHAAARFRPRRPDEVLVSSTTSESLEGSGLTLEDPGDARAEGPFRRAPHLPARRHGHLSTRSGRPAPVLNRRRAARVPGSHRLERGQRPWPEQVLDLRRTARRWSFQSRCRPSLGEVAEAATAPAGGLPAHDADGSQEHPEHHDRP